MCTACWRASDMTMSWLQSISDGTLWQRREGEGKNLTGTPTHITEPHMVIVVLFVIPEQRVPQEILLGEKNSGLLQNRGTWFDDQYEPILNIYNSITFQNSLLNSTHLDVVG